MGFFLWNLKVGSMSLQFFLITSLSVLVLAKHTKFYPQFLKTKYFYLCLLLSFFLQILLFFISCSSFLLYTIISFILLVFFFTNFLLSFDSSPLNLCSLSLLFYSSSTFSMSCSSFLIFLHGLLT